MTALIAAGVVTVVVICAADVLAPRLRTAAPLLLVLIGISASLIPGMPTVELEPDVVLEVILPPLLYAAAVAMPSMSFKREFSAISGLAVPLVVLSSVLLGLLFWWLVPDLGFLWGMALGAILSPTDAVATSIITGRGVPSRVVTILQGESLLNDATTLVLLRTAIAATTGGFALPQALGSFAWSVAVAVVIGVLVGFGNFRIRRRISSPTVNTALSFTLPFIASVPTEMLGASGLVAAVVAGLITGFRGPRELPPEHRVTSGVTWESIQLLLEGFVFLTMGLQMAPVLEELHTESIGIWPAIGIAGIALAVVLAVRTAWIGPQLMILARRARRGSEMQPRIQAMQERLDVAGRINQQHIEAFEKARAAAAARADGCGSPRSMPAGRRCWMRAMTDCSARRSCSGSSRRSMPRRSPCTPRGESRSASRAEVSARRIQSGRSSSGLHGDLAVPQFESGRALAPLDPFPARIRAQAQHHEHREVVVTMVLTRRCPLTAVASTSSDRAPRTATSISPIRPQRWRRNVSTRHSRPTAAPTPYSGSTSMMPRSEAESACRSEGSNISTSTASPRVSSSDRPTSNAEARRPRGGRARSRPTPESAGATGRVIGSADRSAAPVMSRTGRSPSVRTESPPPLRW